MLRKCTDEDISDEECKNIIDPFYDNFDEPNEFPKEQLFFTYEEFKQFLSVETDIKWIGIFEILYYCGLRRGELRGLTWGDIDLVNKLYQLKSKSQIVVVPLKSYNSPLQRPKAV